ncbi:MarR family winged helix-turn-helix transcriptional regulator [Thermomonospora amylolytica]|uniref:MarR family winged helix-turn-helix transcriptional regulator n=1 Tax=Thermomonospora amylolytica TaxID=1411117 RepID=UPI000E6D13AA|nr:MarR family transcriptional regulator [Thermomonospora amylolytica]
MATDLLTTLSETPGYLLRRVYVHLTADALRDGPDSRDFVVLDALADQDATSQAELAERLGINRTIMVKLVDRLQEAGYVTRTRNPANRRSYVLSLTDDGRRALADMRRAVSDRDARITAPLTPAERQWLNRLLGRLLPDPEQPAVRSTEYLVVQAHHRLRRSGEALLAEVGLRTRHFTPLAALDRLAPCPQQHLARAMNVTEPAAAQVVDELVQAGLVVRGQDPHDRRRYALDLTDLGRKRLAFVREVIESLRAEIVDVLGPEGERDLRALLAKLLPDVTGPR